VLSSWRTWSLAVGLVSIVAGCTHGADRSHAAVEVKAGIFFGGQLQERLKWPLVLDPTRQTQGFRVRFREPLSESAQLSWEIARPRLDLKRRVVVTQSRFEAAIPPGTLQNDQLIVLDESDRPGHWKLQVALRDTTVFGATIEVVPFTPAPGDD
jgi:hypothetical protein